MLGLWLTDLDVEDMDFSVKMKGVPFLNPLVVPALPCLPACSCGKKTCKRQSKWICNMCIGNWNSEDLSSPCDWHPGLPIWLFAPPLAESKAVCGAQWSGCRPGLRCHQDLQCSKQIPEDRCLEIQVFWIHPDHRWWPHAYRARWVSFEFAWAKPGTIQSWGLFFVL